MILRSLLAAVVLFAAFGASAQPAPVTNSRMVPAQVQPGADAALDERQAREWGLRSEEWARYRQLMQGPLGVYSPQLDPLTALGIEARSEEERRRYAELQVQAEAQRVGKTLAYQRAYDAAWQRLFPGQPRVSLPGAKAQGAGNTGSGRLAVFVKADCAPCAQRVQQLQAAGTAFDLYMVGSRQDDARIRQWATQAGIDPARVRARTITLNHDAAREVPPPAYQLAAHRADVPAAVLYAVALQESGAMLRGRLIPWPWTLNVAGTPQRYATRAEACAGLHRALAHTPANRIDAGLGQVNLGYHTHRYTQPCELLDPYRNLAIAAEILREQHTPGEDWLLAIGRYHRPAGGAPAARYRRSVHRHLTRVLDPGVPVPTLQATTP